MNLAGIFVFRHSLDTVNIGYQRDFGVILYAMKMVEILWVDAKSGPNEWEYLDGLEPLKPVLCKTIGFLIDEAKEYITIAQSMSDTQVHGRITIPARCIRRIRRLK